MKKLQLLALTMLLSTPVAITYTSSDAATATQDNISDRQAERQASRNARRDELKSRESAVKDKKDAFMATDRDLQAKKGDFGQILHSQIQAVEDEIKGLNLSSDQSQAGRAALLNLHEERDTLRSRLQHHKYTLQTRKSLLMGHADCIQNHINDLEAEQAQVQDAKTGLSQDNPKDTPRLQYLQDRITDISAEVATRKNDLAAVTAQVKAAQDSLDALQSKKAEAKGQAVKGKKNS